MALKVFDIDSEIQRIDYKNSLENCRSLLREKFKKTQPTYFIHSYGCQGNVSDGERIKGILNEMNLLNVSDTESADIVILNGCAIRENAQNRVIGNLGRVIHEKETDKDKIIILCGCMFQQDELSKNVLDTFKGVDLIFGTHVIDKLPTLLSYVISENKRFYYAPILNKIIDERIKPFREDKIKSLVPISYGCNNYCSYCIVPYVKGRERSRNSEDIIKEVESLVENNYKEITLLGQNVNSYGNDLENEINFSKLLTKLNDIKGEFKIRFMTSHPKDATKELIDTISSLDKVCNHIHLPVQSGSDRILKMMNRKYTVDDYLKIIDYAKKKIKNVTFSSDIIVGFPGEQEEDFIKTLNLVKEVRYLSLFTFIYSKRPKTKAATMKDTTEPSIKNERLTRLIETQNKISEEIHSSYLNTKQKILIEGKSRVNDKLLTGRTDTHLVVDVEGDESLIGKFCDVFISDSFRLALKGKLL